MRKPLALFPLIGILGSIPALPLHADVRVPHVIGDNMVLQREKPVPIWGWADPGEEVSVTFGGQSKKTKANDSGKWMVKLDPMPANAKPGIVVIQGKNELQLKDVLVGEVWLCSGQSNMAWQVGNSNNAKEEIASANWPQIRQIKMPLQPASRPVDDRDASWAVCSPATVAQWTACGYFFGRKLHQELGVPIGLLNASWGGTRIEPWTPPVGFEGVESLAEISETVALADPTSPIRKERVTAYVNDVEKWFAKAKAAAAKGESPPAQPQAPAGAEPLASRKNPQQQPTTLYNGMIHPLVPFALRGAIWYQGESNRAENDYTEKTRALVEGWRKVWGEPDLPYYFVQIAPFQYGNESPGILARFWEQQAAVADEIPHTGMVVINDIGNLKDIHPRNKQDVGLRLALQALAQTYGKKDIVFSGPRFREMAIEGNKIKVTFGHVGGGLTSRDGKPLSHWEILGEGTGWEKAEAAIDGTDSLIVSSAKVDNPLSVRFAWHKLAEPNLMNKEGLPAAPFRAGEIFQPDMLKLHFKDAGEHHLLYDLDLADLGATPGYTTNNTEKFSGTKFSRVTYFLELQKDGEPIHYAKVSSDAFTHDVSKLGVPTAQSGAHFQQAVKNLSVSSDVAGVKNGENLPGGHIEFWPNDYRAPNGANVEGASETIYDFGDQPGGPADGYGSMQIHNIKAKQTVFAINMWKAGANADIGIGNSPGQHKDWTFSKTGGQYSLKRLRIFIK